MTRQQGLLQVMSAKFTRAAFLRGFMQVQAGGLGIRYEVLAA